MPPELRRTVATIGERNRLGTDWLNDAAKGFTPDLDPNPIPVFDGDRLKVYSADARYLLAMKLYAARADDLADAVLLAQNTQVSSTNQLLDLVTNAYPTRAIDVSVQYFAEEVAAHITEPNT